MPIIGIIASAITGHLAPPIVPAQFESIATTTVGSGGSATITFSSIPSTFKHLQVRVALNTTTAQAEFIKLWYNNDTTTTNYANHVLYSNGSTAGTFTSTSASSRAYHVYTVSNGWNQPNVAIIDLLDYTNTNKYRTTKILYGSDDNGGSRCEVGLSSGLYMSTTAINRIDFQLSSGSNFPQYSSFALYGIKGA